MLVVKVELHSAVTKEVTTLGEMVIDNIGGTKTLGNYRVRVARKGSKLLSLLRGKAKPVRAGEVMDYPRLNYSVWILVTRALLECYPEEKK